MTPRHRKPRPWLRRVLWRTTAPVAVAAAVTEAERAGAMFIWLTCRTVTVPGSVSPERVTSPIR